MSNPQPVQPAPNDSLPFVLRAANINDKAIIVADWLRSNRLSPFNRDVPEQLYFTKHRQLIEGLLSRSYVQVACNPDDPEQVFAWCCFGYINDLLVVHYAYTKETYRKQGVAKQLIASLLRQPLDKTVIICTHLTRKFRELAERYPLIFDPYILGGL